LASATSRIVSVATALAIVAWLLLLLSFVYAKFFVTEPAPNVVITFSNKGLTRLFAELLSLGIGCLGLLLAVIALARPGRDWRLAVAAVSNAAVCAVCVALLM
jgi:hypothetical protein